MRISLKNPLGRIVLIAASLLGTTAYLAVCAAQFVAAYLSTRPELASLEWAVKLEPSNAEYRFRVGRYFWLVQRDVNAALPFYRAAVASNPHVARYWFDLAATYEFLGYADGQKDALEHAVQADPTTPTVAWQAANFYLVQGNVDKALGELRIVLTYDPYLPAVALPLCWRLEPNIDVLLRDVIPPDADVYSSFLHYLVSKNELSAANKVWGQLARLQQPVERQNVFEYIRSLLLQGDVAQAQMVWQQAATLSDLSDYQPTAENLIVNGNFSLNVLNGGFDWLYNRSEDVALSLDPTHTYTGSRSLLITFDARKIDDAGIRQVVPVSPNTGYEFLAYYRAEDLEGAGGPRFAIQGVYDGKTYFTSDTLENVDSWNQVTGDFITGPQTKMLVLHIQRFPTGAIKGKLWIDGVRLMPKSARLTAPQG